MYKVKFSTDGHCETIVCGGLFEGVELDKAKEKADEMARRYPGIKYLVRDIWGNEIYSAQEEPLPPALYRIKEVGEDRNHQTRHKNIADLELVKTIALELAMSHHNQRYVVVSNQNINYQYAVELVEEESGG